MNAPQDKPVRVRKNACLDCVYFRQSDRWTNDHCLKRAKTLYCADARKDESLCGNAGRWFKDSGRTYFPPALPPSEPQP